MDIEAGPRESPQQYNIPQGWTFISKIGSGGNGVALRVSSGTIMACCKLLLPDHHSPYNLRRFQREETALKKLRSDSIPSLLHSDTSSPQSAYLLLELVGDRDLQDLVGWKKVHNILTQEEAFPLLKQLLETLQYCHSQQIIHRDIKANNIRYCEQQHKIHLIDFGLAWLADHEEEEEEALTNTLIKNGLMQLPEFLVPGQMRHPASDLTLAFAVYHFLRTGEKGLNLSDNKPTLKDPPYNLLELTLLTKAFSEKVEDRFQTVEEIYEHLASSPQQLEEIRVLQLNKPVTPPLDVEMAAIVSTVCYVVPKKSYGRVKITSSSQLFVEFQIPHEIGFSTWKLTSQYPGSYEISHQEDQFFCTFTYRYCRYPMWAFQKLLLEKKI